LAETLPFVGDDCRSLDNAIVRGRRNDFDAGNTAAEEKVGLVLTVFDRKDGFNAAEADGLERRLVLADSFRAKCDFLLGAAGNKVDASIAPAAEGVGLLRTWVVVDCVYHLDGGYCSLKFNNGFGKFMKLGMLLMLGVGTARKRFL
jgi:hypothetical protein